MGALTGLRVIGLTRVVAGPSATQALDDHGADVIKVEPDDRRGASVPRSPTSPPGCRRSRACSWRSTSASAPDAGKSIAVSLLDAAVTLLHPHAPNHLMSGRRAPRTGSNRHPNICPYDRFPSATVPVFLAVGNDRQFARLCAELGRPKLADGPRFLRNADRLANREALTGPLAARLADRDGTALAEHLLRLGVPAGAVLDVPEALGHPQIRHRRMVLERDSYRGVGIPVKLDRTPGELRRVPPLSGEQGREVLREAGFGEAEIEALVAAGAVVVEPRP